MNGNAILRRQARGWRFCVWRYSSILLLLLSIVLPAHAQPPLNFTARWVSSTIAVIRWQQPAAIGMTCLTRETATHQRWLMRCWADLPAGLTAFTLGDTGPLDYMAHPQVGDRYVLTLDDHEERAELLALVWLAMIRG